MLTDTLTPLDKHRLTIWKWRYRLGADPVGFSAAQIARLCWMRWLYLKGRLIT
jgi:hypothetical protein